MSRARGFSLFELAVAFALIAILAGTLLERMVYYQERAEKANMEYVAMDIRSSVNLRVAELALDNRLAELDTLAAQNPLDLLHQKPQNYLGVLSGAPPAAVTPGNWYFDKKKSEVVYCADLGRFFVSDADGRKCAFWHIAVARDDKQAPQWARFEPVAAYRWF